MSKYHLHFLHGFAENQVVPLPENGELVMGRAPGEAGLDIPERNSSRRNTAIECRDGKLELRDLESKNGTFVNRKRVTGSVALRQGDHIQIGSVELALVGSRREFRCASCVQTLIEAPPEAPFCSRCRDDFPLLGATLARRRLVRGLGNGSFGSAYIGHRDGNPYVALKVLHVEFTESPDVVMKFLKEAYATSGLNHKNIVRFGDSGHEGRHWYIILEYFPSESLGHILRDRGPLEVDEALNITNQVASALTYAHQHRLLHRDIKPGNILVGNGGLVKVIDFGLAKRLVDSEFTSHTQSGTAGTPLYMAPELLRGDKPSRGADLYSLAATLYRMLTGKHPVEEDLLDDWIKAVQTGSPEPVRSVRPDVPQRVSDAIDQALLKYPRDRPRSVIQFMSQLGVRNIP